MHFSPNQLRPAILALFRKAKAFRPGFGLMALLMVLALDLDLASEARANNYDAVGVANERVSIYFDASVQREDASGVGYLARFLRASEDLPPGIRVGVGCADQSLSVYDNRERQRGASPGSRALYERLSRSFARDLERNHPPSRRLRSCLARATRIIQRHVPSFQPASESANWYSVEVEFRDEYHAVYLEGSLVQHHYLSGERSLMGFFLSREDAEDALAWLANEHRDFFLRGQVVRGRAEHVPTV